MKRSLQIVLSTLASACICSLSAQAQTQTYAGNGGTSFGGPAGNGMLSLSSDGTSLSGTITPGINNTTATPPTGQFYDELVFYVDTGAPGGVTTTAGLVSNGDTNSIAAAGTNGTAGVAATKRATVDFVPGFAANFALVLSVDNSQLGSLYSFNSDGTLNLVATTNLTPTGGSGPASFNFPLSDIGSVAGFDFATTYLNSHSDVYRSNEAIGNTVTDTTTPGNTGNLGQDTALLGEATFNGGIALVPEPSTWAMMLVGVVALAGFQIRRLSRS